MATVSICLCKTQNTFPDGSPMPVVSSVPLVDETQANPTSSQQSTGSVPTFTNRDTRHGLVWEIAASGGAIWVAFGSNPTAAAGTSFMVPDGAVRHFGAGDSGEKVAVINA